MPVNMPDERDRHVPPMEFNPIVKALDEDIDENTPVEELEDGSALVQLDDEETTAENDEFYANLAEKLPSDVLDSLARELIENVDFDREARKKRDEQYAEGIKRTGLGNEAPGGAEFAGASRAVHPALVEGCIDFAARAVKEIFPPSGPCKTHIIGTATAAKLQKADRKRRYMNWQLTTQIAEYKRELEVLLTQLPLGGSQYQKFYWDRRRKRPGVMDIFVDKLHLPFAATSLYTAERATHEEDITRAEYEERVASGLYKDYPAELGDSALLPDPTAAEEAAAKVEGKEDINYNEDGLRRVLESQIDLMLPDDELGSKEFKRPYILHVCETSSKVLGLYRNWEEDDENAEKLDWFVDYTMIPWRGAQGIGLAHIIGSLAGAATGSLRALLDSAHINNMACAVKLKGARVSGQNLQIQPTEIAELEGPAGINDIRQLAMPLPFNPPSTVLYQLLEWLTNQAKGVLAVAEEKIGDAGANMPVGTALALIEQGSITFSSIHGRLHESQRKALSIIHRLNAEHLDDEVTLEELGDLVVKREDFQGPMDVIPVTDPNIFSDAQRYAQIQAVHQLAATNPGLYKQDKLHKRTLQLLKVPEFEELLNVPGEPEQRDPIVENVEASKQETQLKAYANEDHIAHLTLHLQFATNPIFCANPLMGGIAMGKLLEHCKEHLLMYYTQNMLAAAQAQMTMARGMAEPQALMAGSAMALAEAGKELQPIMQMLAQAMQLSQQFAPKPPADPRIEVARIQADTANKRNEMEDKFKNLELRMTDVIEKMALQAENQQHSDEMMLAGRNADIAAITEEANRKTTEYLSVLKEVAATERQERDNSMKILLAEMQKERENSSQILAKALEALTQQTVDNANKDKDGKAQITEHVNLQTQQLSALNEAVTAALRQLNAMANQNRVQ